MARRRDEVSNPFLKAAEKKLNDEQAKRNDEQRLVDAKKSAARKQVEYFDANLRPLLSQLASLPAKDGRKFAINWEMVGEEHNPRLVATIEYTGGEYKPNMMRGGRIRGPGLRDAMRLVISNYENEDVFSTHITREDQYVSSERMTHTTFAATTVEAIHSALGDFVATVAADRIAELGGSAPAPEKKKEIPGFSKELWDAVGDALDEPAQKPKPRTPRGRR